MFNVDDLCNLEAALADEIGVIFLHLIWRTSTELDVFFCVDFLTEDELQSTIHTRMITNKNLGICFGIRFRNGKANQFPQICFRNDHVGHAQATTAGHAYEIN